MYVSRLFQDDEKSKESLGAYTLLAVKGTGATKIGFVTAQIDVAIGTRVRKKKNGDDVKLMEEKEWGVSLSFQSLFPRKFPWDTQIGLSFYVYSADLTPKTRYLTGLHLNPSGDSWPTILIYWEKNGNRGLQLSYPIEVN